MVLIDRLEDHQKILIMSLINKSETRPLFDCENPWMLYKEL